MNLDAAMYFGGLLGLALITIWEARDFLRQRKRRILGIERRHQARKRNLRHKLEGGDV